MPSLAHRDELPGIRRLAAPQAQEDLPVLRRWGREILSVGSLPVVVRMFDPTAPVAAEEVLP